MTYDEVKVDQAGHVRTITLNRPDRLNAWTPALDKELRSAVTEAGSDPSVWAIVITGAGRGFCAGADLDVLPDALSVADEFNPPVVSDPTDIENNYRHEISYLLRIPKPIFAAINGPAAGFGASLAIFCDFRFMAESAKFTTMFARRGLIAEYGIAWMLQRQIGLMNAYDLLMSARTVLGPEAERIGFARSLPDEGFLQAVQEIAANMVTNASPRSASVIKRQLYDGMFHNLSDANEMSFNEALEAFKSEDFKEGVAHFLERRPAAFKGR